MLVAQPRRPLTIDGLITPQLAAALDQLDFVSRRVFAGRLQGERRSKARGRSVEFEDFRAYVPGDDLRHVDWNVFARLDRLFIKVFLEEQDLAMHIVLDASPSMDAGNPSKFILAQRLAMALGYLGLVNNNRVAVWAFGGPGETRLRHLPPLRGRPNARRLAAFLLRESEHPAETAPGPHHPRANDFTLAMRSIAAARSGKGVIILLSDLLIPEGYAQGLASLIGDAHSWDATLLQILSPGELDPLSETDTSGGRSLLGDLRLTDAETGRTAEVTVTADLVKRYKERLARYQAGLRSFCTSRALSHILVRSDADINAFVLHDLRRRALLR